MNNGTNWYNTNDREIIWQPVAFWGAWSIVLAEALESWLNESSKVCNIEQTPKVDLARLLPY